MKENKNKKKQSKTKQINGLLFVLRISLQEVIKAAPILWLPNSEMICLAYTTGLLLILLWKMSVVFRKNTTRCPQPGLKPGPLKPESSTLYTRSPGLDLPQQQKKHHAITTTTTPITMTRELKLNEVERKYMINAKGSYEEFGKLKKNVLLRVHREINCFITKDSPYSFKLN